MRRPVRRSRRRLPRRISAKRALALTGSHGAMFEAVGGNIAMVGDRSTSGNRLRIFPAAVDGAAGGHVAAAALALVLDASRDCRIMRPLRLRPPPPRRRRCPECGTIPPEIVEHRHNEGLTARGKSPAQAEPADFPPIEAEKRRVL